MNDQLVSDNISRDLVSAFEEMSVLVRQGRIVGVVFGLALKGPGRKFHVNVAGSLTRDPTFARGIVAALDDELRVLVHSKSDASKTR
ncbi:MAG: hypothetical protein H7255_16865 [Ramlibacter sp.]|nr:hypothetical protein [Ramlibacter sp.]